MPTQITAYRDSRGVIHSTLEEANTAESGYSSAAELASIAAILQTASGELGYVGLPKSIEAAARVFVQAYPAAKTYYGD